MQAHGKRPTLGEMLLQHVIVFLLCIAFPGAVTLMAPATWLTYERGGETVRCTTRTCMFFIVPFKIQHVDQVTGISERERAGGIRRQRQYSRETNQQVHVEGEGLLQIHGLGDHAIEVSVSPASLENVVRKSNEFLSSTQEGSTTMFAIANWKFGALMGGILTMFTLLYVVGYSLAFLKWNIMVLKKAIPGSTSVDGK